MRLYYAVCFSAWVAVVRLFLPDDNDRYSVDTANRQRAPDKARLQPRSEPIDRQIIERGRESYEFKKVER